MAIVRKFCLDFALAKRCEPSCGWCGATMKRSQQKHNGARGRRQPSKDTLDLFGTTDFALLPLGHAPFSGPFLCIEHCDRQKEPYDGSPTPDE